MPEINSLILREQGAIKWRNFYAQKARAAEQRCADIIEQCAKVAEEQRTDDDSMWDRAAKLIGNEIRALAQTGRG